MVQYDKSMYYIDFSKNTMLTDEEKTALEKIQELYRPIERVPFLNEYRIEGKISADEYEQMTGIPYSYD